MSKIAPYIEWKDTVAFVPPIKEGHVIKVYDGDTITIASTLPIVNSPLYRFSVRLSGIDSAEIKSKNLNEKDHAKKVRDILSELILHKTVTLKNISTEKYGRILADVYLDDLFINEWMLNEGYAVEYNGGTKSTTWSEI
jgi:micrococcal nuclease